MLQQRNDSQNPSPTPIHDESWRWCSESCHWKSPRETAHSWQVAVNDDEVNCIACLRKSLSAPILATSWLETLPQTPSDKSKGHEKRLHWDKHSSGSPAKKMIIHGNWNQLHRLFDRQVTFDGQVTDDSLWNKLWDSSRALPVMLVPGKKSIQIWKILHLSMISWLCPSTCQSFESLFLVFKAPANANVNCQT